MWVRIYRMRCMTQNQLLRKWRLSLMTWFHIFDVQTAKHLQLPSLRKAFVIAGSQCEAAFS
jgi:hypothetical protein